MAYCMIFCYVLHANNDVDVLLVSHEGDWYTSFPSAVIEAALLYGGLIRNSTCMVVILLYFSNPKLCCVNARSKPC